MILEALSVGNLDDSWSPRSTQSSSFDLPHCGGHWLYLPSQITQNYRARDHQGLVSGMWYCLTLIWIWFLGLVSFNMFFLCLSIIGISFYVCAFPLCPFFWDTHLFLASLYSILYIKDGSSVIMLQIYIFKYILKNKFVYYMQKIYILYNKNIHFKIVSSFYFSTWRNLP